jgi:hypothetical protein
VAAPASCRRTLDESSLDAATSRDINPVREHALKFDELRSIAHNIAESFASGGILVLPTSFGTIHVFTEARRSPEGYIVIDFLSGRSAGARPSPSLAQAIEFYGDALADLCGRHGTSPSAFRELTARYSVDKRAKRFVVTTADHHGRLQVDEYIGMPGKRVRTLKRLGRVPSKKIAPLPAQCRIK